MPGWVAARKDLFAQSAFVPPPLRTYNFLTSAPGALVFTRSGPGTDGMPSDNTYTSYGTDVPVLKAGVGLYIFGSTTNRLAPSTTIATGTTNSIPTGTYTVSISGSGSVAVAAGTAVGSGFGTVTSAAPLTVTIGTAGTLALTKTGTVNWMQIESGSYPSPIIVTTASAVTRQADNATIDLSALFGNAEPCTIYMQGVLLSDPSPGAQVTVLTLGEGAGASNNRLTLRKSAYTMNAQAAAGGVAVTSGSVPGLVVGQVFRAAVACRQPGLDLALNGRLAVGALNGLVGAGAVTLGIGKPDGGSTTRPGCVYQEISVWKSGLSPDQLALLTQLK